MATQDPAAPLDRRAFVGTTAAYFIASALAAACGAASDATAPGDGPTPGGGGNGGGGQTGVTINGSTVSVNVAQASIGSAGQFLIVSGADAIVINVGTGFVALSKTCTHNACAVARFNNGSSLIECDCHGSRFRTSGQVANGPATQPLKTYAVTANGGVVTFSV